MDDVIRIVVKDENIDSLLYDESIKSVVVTFKGGSKWKYSGVTPEEFAEFIIRTPREILEKIRHNNLVGVRVY